MSTTLLVDLDIRRVAKRLQLYCVVQSLWRFFRGEYCCEVFDSHDIREFYVGNALSGELHCALQDLRRMLVRVDLIWDIRENILQT